MLKIIKLNRKLFWFLWIFLYNSVKELDMKIAISAESTIDLPKELLEEYEIHTLPYTIILGDKEYFDGEIMPEEIFKFYEETKTLPKTSAINTMQYQEYFNMLLKEYDGVIHFCLSGEISSSCKNAMEAAEKFKNVYVVDTKSLSTGIALQAIYASNLAKNGVVIKEIYERAMKRVPYVQASFVLKKLEFLYKGGRCSALSYFGANLLQIRPQIILKDGKMGPHKKYRGNMEKVVKSYCEDTLAEFNNPDLSIGFVTYTTASDEMVKIAKDSLINRGFKTIYCTKAGATISSHCGENTLGILYINDGGVEE